MIIAHLETLATERRRVLRNLDRQLELCSDQIWSAIAGKRESVAFELASIEDAQQRARDMSAALRDLLDQVESGAVRWAFERVGISIDTDAARSVLR